MKGVCTDKEVETSGQIVESEVEKFRGREGAIHLTK